MYNIKLLNIISITILITWKTHYITNDVIILPIVYDLIIYSTSWVRLWLITMIALEV